MKRWLPIFAAIFLISVNSAIAGGDNKPVQVHPDAIKTVGAFRRFASALAGKPKPEEMIPHLDALRDGLKGIDAQNPDFQRSLAERIKPFLLGSALSEEQKDVLIGVIDAHLGEIPGMPPVKAGLSKGHASNAAIVAHAQENAVALGWRKTITITAPPAEPASSAAAPAAPAPAPAKTAAAPTPAAAPAKDPFVNFARRFESGLPIEFKYNGSAVELPPISGIVFQVMSQAEVEAAGGKFGEQIGYFLVRKENPADANKSLRNDQTTEISPDNASRLGLAFDFPDIFEITRHDVGDVTTFKLRKPRSATAAAPAQDDATRVITSAQSRTKPGVSPYAAILQPAPSKLDKLMFWKRFGKNGTAEWQDLTQRLSSGETITLEFPKGKDSMQIVIDGKPLVVVTAKRALSIYASASWFSLTKDINFVLIGLGSAEAKLNPANIGSELWKMKRGEAATISNGESRFTVPDAFATPARITWAGEARFTVAPANKNQP